MIRKLEIYKAKFQQGLPEIPEEKNRENTGEATLEEIKTKNLLVLKYD